MYRVQNLSFCSAYKTLLVVSLTPVNIWLLDLKIRSKKPTLVYLLSGYLCLF